MRWAPRATPIGAGRRADPAAELVRARRWRASRRNAVAALLQTGVSDGAALLGPMAEVVLHSTQHLTPSDLLAMARYLQSLPRPTPPRGDPSTPPPAQLERGAKHLRDTHARTAMATTARAWPRAYVPLAGNRACCSDPPANLVQVVLGGAFPPSTAGNPRPFGMPPFATELSDEDIAAVLSYIRNAWGNRAGAVQPLDVQRWRSSVRP